MLRPLQNHLCFHATNPMQACDQLAKIYSEHKLDVLTEQQDEPLNAWFNHAAMPRLSLNFLEYGAEVQVSAEGLDNFYLVQVPLSGQCDIQTDSKCVTARPATAFIATFNKKMQQHISADSRLLQIKIDRTAIEHKLSDLLERPITKPVEFDLLMPLQDPKGASWWRSIEYLINEFEQEESFLISGPGVTGVEHAVITSLLYAQPHNYSEALQIMKTPIAPAHVKRAEQYMQDEIASPITLAELVAVCQVSERTLHESFKRFRQTTPMNYLRTIRLKNVHKDLICAKDKVCITDVATKWGFTQLGRFSSLYKKMYGESPSETLRRHLKSY